MRIGAGIVYLYAIGMIANVQPTPFDEVKMDSGYVKVRGNAFAFWLLYYQDASFAPDFLPPLDQTPLFVWLQGGPGGSSTGYGNFEELGPLDLKLNRRNTSWTGLGHVLFIDHPVGSGYSYVTDRSAYAADVEQASVDFVAVMKGFYEKTGMQNLPMYIYCESYGGKMAAGAAKEIVKGINEGTLTANFKGVGLGDAWISPIDSVTTWGEYLYEMSLLDDSGLLAVKHAASAVEKAIDNGQWALATRLRTATKAVIKKYADNVDLYNILYPHHAGTTKNKTSNATSNKIHKHAASDYDEIFSIYATDPLYDLMNGPFKEYLGIPDSVVWSSQSDEVFDAMRGDFMKPVIDIVDTNINDGIDVVVYNGMLDMVVDTPGQELWVKKLKWNKLPTFLKTKWSPMYTMRGDTGGYVKKVDNFSFWWVIDGGHMLPIDQGDFMLRILYATCTS